ncbi:Glu/Leu/Phe/Val dehydrogenase dimerization domain-containing protein [Thermodesulfobacteriota bacterium]
MQILDYMCKHGHEQLIIQIDKRSALKAVMAIHDTTFGPALGPARMAIYRSEHEAILESLRFSQSQTYKYIAAGLPFSGGRIIVIGDPSTDKSENLVRALGRFVEFMSGRYIITGGGAGFTDEDTSILVKETSHIIGIPSALGGSGEPALYAAYGVYLGMKVCAQMVFGSDSLKNRTIALQGFGKVGSALAKYLQKEGAIMMVSDIRSEAVEIAREHLGAEIVDSTIIYDVMCDIFSPCAWSGVLNKDTIPRLKCKIVAGPANNQLDDRETDSIALQERGIVYIPDYIINVGGFINITSEIEGYEPNEVKKKIKKTISSNIEKILSCSTTEGRTPLQVADSLIEERIQQA